MFLSDSRGNRLEAFEVASTPGSSRELLLLRGPPEVARQVRWLGGCKPETASREWTHKFSYERGVPERVMTTLAVCQEALVLVPRSPLDVAIALDFYKDPESHEDPMHWSNTHAGSLVHKGKYWSDEAAEQELAVRLTDVVGRHGLYGLGDLVLSVPGHDQSKRPSFGERLATRVAEMSGKRLVEAQARSPIRPPAKERQPDDPDLATEFEIDNGVDGQVVIVVDDVWGHGDTLAAVSKQTKTRGARRVLALVGARRMRS